MNLQQIRALNDKREQDFREWSTRNPDIIRFLGRFNSTHSGFLSAMEYKIEGWQVLTVKEEIIVRSLMKRNLTGRAVEEGTVVFRGRKELAVRALDDIDTVWYVSFTYGRRGYLAGATVAATFEPGEGVLTGG